MMRSHALTLLPTLTPVTAQTITLKHIDIALLCHTPLHADPYLHEALILATDDLEAGNIRTARVALAVWAVNEMIASRS